MKLGRSCLINIGKNGQANNGNISVIGNAVLCLVKCQINKVLYFIFTDSNGRVHSLCLQFLLSCDVFCFVFLIFFFFFFWLCFITSTKGQDMPSAEIRSGSYFYPPSLLTHSCFLIKLLQNVLLLWGSLQFMKIKRKLDSSTQIIAYVYMHSILIRGFM